MEPKVRNKVFFSEVQQLSGSPLRYVVPAILLMSLLPLGYEMVQQLVLGKPWGNEPPSDLGLVLTFVFVLLLTGFVWFMFLQNRLEITIDVKGIHYRFPIFIRKERLITKDKIDRYEVRKYRPLWEYGGWGYRGGRKRYRMGNAYNIKGNMGLQLYFTNGEKLLLGTQRPDAMKRAMKKLMDEEELFHD